jgi:hypothetical protein
MKSSLAIRVCGMLSGAAALALLSPLLLSAQARIEGQITDGTEHRSVPNQEVRLLAPWEGMQELATASTDANGRFMFGQSGIDPNAFYLLETRFQGIAYHAPAQFDSTGSASVSLTVYESTRSPAALRIQAFRALVRAEGPKARVQEEYEVLNSSDPPRAYVSDGGTFRFRLSPGAGQPSVAVAGLMNMPLQQTPEPGKSAGEFYIRYPLKPGITQVAVSYEADYTSSHLELSDRVSYPIDQAQLFVFPASLSVDSPIFKPAGVDSTHNVQKLEAWNLGREAPLEVRLSGEATAASQPETEQAEVEVKIVANSMTKLGVPLLACFLLVLLWALGVRVAKEWPQWQARRGHSPVQKQLGAKVEGLVNSLADLDELFAAGKIGEAKYWKERLELKARLAAVLKKAPPSLLETYATRNAAR